ncbi:MAG: hypothetical protein R6X25_03125, partial [Candidatus Krumholzibacteriia bacterium]
QTPAEEIGGDQPRLLRGTVVQEAPGLVFTPGGSDDRFLLADRTTLGLAGLVAREAGDDRPAYLEFMGETGPGPAGDSPSEVAGVVLVSHLLFVGFGEGRGCEEDLAGVEMVARGQEPGWQVEIRKDGAVFRTPEQPDGVRFSELTASHAGGGRVYEAVRDSADGGPGGLTLSLAPEPCRDGMTGDWHSWRAELSVDGNRLTGCARPGHPAPGTGT